jgi:hypothetical protein
MSGFYYRKIFFSAVLGVLFASRANALEVLPVLKEGNCPTGYHVSGWYCVPSKNARFAIKKIFSLYKCH